MDAAYISALAALAGSAIGGFASFATTWLTHHQQERATRLAQKMSRRERLYGEFTDEASRLLADALTHHLEEPSRMVALYAIMGKLRLFAPGNVVARADEVMAQIDLRSAEFGFPRPDGRVRAESRRHPAGIRRGLPGGPAALHATRLGGMRHRLCFSRGSRAGAASGGRCSKG